MASMVHVRTRRLVQAGMQQEPLWLAQVLKHPPLALPAVAGGPPGAARAAADAPAPSKAVLPSLAWEHDHIRRVYFSYFGRATTTSLHPARSDDHHATNFVEEFVQRVLARGDGDIEAVVHEFADEFGVTLLDRVTADSASANAETPAAPLQEVLSFLAAMELPELERPPKLVSPLAAADSAAADDASGDASGDAAPGDALALQPESDAAPPTDGAGLDK